VRETDVRGTAVHENAVRETAVLLGGVAGFSMSPQPVTLYRASATSDETDKTESASASGASKANESRLCVTLECLNVGVSECGACGCVVYCSRACQKLDWPVQKTACKLLRITRPLV
jgi:hypothetical protein